MDRIKKILINAYTSAKSNETNQSYRKISEFIRSLNDDTGFVNKSFFS